MRALSSALLILGLAVPASAQIATSATPVYHGVLDVQRAHGTIDPATGTATVKVGRWRFLVRDVSNGIYPDLEPIDIAIGEQNFTLPAGTLRAKRRGRVFFFRAPKADTMQPVRLLRITRLGDHTYAVRFTLQGVELSQLILQDPVCMPTAVLVGDDDAFAGVLYTRPTFESHRLTIPSDCPIGTDWPWINN